LGGGRNSGWLAVGVEHDPDEVAVARHPPHRRRGEVEAVVGHPDASQVTP
jgi:hypothetical protein